MKNYVRIACLTSMILWLVPTIALAGTKEKSSTFDWNPVIDAIIAVESEGNAKAIDYSGRSCGILQITPVLVKECNRILKILKSTKRYVLGDRFNAAKSKEMFLLYQSFYNPQNDVEKAIRSWNGGPNYSNRGTERYYQKVLRRMK